MKRVAAWVLILFFSLALKANAQNLKIIHIETQKPLSGAILLQEHPLVSATTNIHGFCKLNDFDLERPIEISLDGFKSQKILLKTDTGITALIFLEPQTLRISEIIVSATRWHESSKNIPVQTSSVSAKEISLGQPQTAADLLDLSGKVFIQKSQQGGGSPMIRGFATNRLIYTVDGVRMNTAIFRGGNIQNVISLDPFNTEQAEVIFGPGSVIYGSDAIGGVMSYQTLRPQLSTDDKPLFNGNADFRHSTANKEKTAHFDFKVGLKNWAFVSSYTHWDFDHLQQGRFGPVDYLKTTHVERINNVDSIIEQGNPFLQVPTGYQQNNFMQKVLFKPNENWEFQYGFHFSRTSNFGRYDRHNRLRRGIPNYAEWEYGPQSWLMHLLQINHRGLNRFYDQMSIRLAQQQFEESRIDRDFNSQNRNTQTENVLALSINTDFSKTLGKENTLFYGIEGVYNDVNSSGTLTQIETQVSQTGPSRYPESQWRSWGIYATDEQEIGDKWTLRTGIRYNWFGLNADFKNNLSFYPLPFQTANLNNDALTGSIGLVYRPTPSLLVRGNLGTAFRSPNVDDMGKIFDNEPGTITIPNPNLKSEYAYNADAGIVKLFGDRFKFEISAYFTQLNNALVRRNFQLNGSDSMLFQGELSQIQAIQNAALAQVFGYHIGWELKWTKKLYWKTDFNFQEGYEELDNGSISPSRHAAPFFGQSRIRYQTSKFTGEINARFQGEQSFDELAFEERGKTEIYAKDAAGNPYSPSWYILNLKVQYQISDWLRINTGIENITDQRYRPYSAGLSGAGRNLYTSIKIIF